MKSVSLKVQNVMNTIDIVGNTSYYYWQYVGNITFEVQSNMSSFKTMLIRTMFDETSL